MKKAGTFKSIFKRGVSFLLIVLTVMSLFTLPAFAANNICAGVKGSSAQTTTFQVTTGGSTWTAKPYITLKQTKGTMKLRVLRLDGGDYDTTKPMYEYYYVTLYKQVKGRWVQQGQPVKWTGSQTKKITLDKNATYQIKIVPYAVKHWDDFVYFGPAFNPYPWSIFPFKVWSPKCWVKNCTWNISAYSRINSCKTVS